jgi:hypothetical protein
MEEAVAAGMAAKYVFVFNDRECGCWRGDLHVEDGGRLAQAPSMTLGDWLSRDPVKTSFTSVSVKS